MSTDTSRPVPAPTPEPASTPTGSPAPPPAGTAPRRLGSPSPNPEALVVPAPARPLQGQAAGVVSRLLAAAIDLAVGLAAVGAIYLTVCGLILLWNPASFHFPSVQRGVLVIVTACVLFIYLAATWAATGRTYGDEVVGLKVVGLRRGWSRVVFCVARAALCLVFPIGLLWSAVSNRRAAVQDLLLGTSVVYAWPGTHVRRR